jgi:pimeloyl-ACP methyl ester carboxylesterase
MLAAGLARRALVVGGDADLDARLYERTAEVLGEGSDTMIVAGAGHWAHREGEDAFLARLIEFARTA